MKEDAFHRTFGDIKVYEDLRDIAGESRKVLVVEILPGFEDIRYFLDAYDELSSLNNPILLTGKKLLTQNIEPLLQICCEQFTIIEVAQPRFCENLELVVDLFLVNVDHELMDAGVLKRYAEVWNGKNLYFRFKPKDADETKEFEELAKSLGLSEKGIPFRIEGEGQG